MKRNKKIVDEGWFRNWMDSETGGEYTRLKGDEYEQIKNPAVIKQVAQTGYNDYVRRLRTEGIDLANRSSVLTNADRIKDSLIEYVQAYLTSRENSEAQNEILIAIKGLSDNFKALPPSAINVNSVKEYFVDTVKIRADVLIKLKNKLPQSNQSNNPPEITNMSSLVANIPDGHEIPAFDTGLSPVGGPWALIRENGVYLNKLPPEIQDAVSKRKINPPEKVEITYKNKPFTAYQVKTAKYQNAIFDIWKNQTGGKLVTTPIVAEI
jgi:hypothetical protein